jgi:virginiamycin B lyase
MNMERVASVLLLAGSIVACTSCAPSTSSAGDLAETTSRISQFALPLLKDADESRWPGDIVSGPDGALWFTELNGERIGRIATKPAGQITEFPIPTRPAAASGGQRGGPPAEHVDPRPGSIALGPDGALWFTVPNFNAIDRITAGGHITEYAAGPDARPADIVAGPDGALWFTLPMSQQIGRITTAGRVTRYRVAGTNSSPQDIAAGPDGALWFTERLGKRIGRITTSGQVTEFPVRVSQKKSGLFGIAQGPDHALWFTEPDGRKIGRITTAGNINEYAVPQGYPTTITAGPDGALWFSSILPSSIGRIRTDGTVEQFRLATNFDKPGAIAAGADGALWFTIYTADAIARIVPP